MIDLHTHTCYSDGSWNIKEILNEAEKKGIEVLAITDHDTVNGVKELAQIDYSKIYKGKIIPGIEFSTVYDGIFFHLLAYGFDYKKLEQWVHKEYGERKPDLMEEYNKMIESCKRNNIKLEKLNYDKSKGWPIDTIFPEIKKHPENKKYFTDKEWNDVKVFFQCCVTRKKFPVYIDFSMNYPTANQVANEVRKAGGKLFVAHVYRYNLEDTKGFLNILKKDNIIDGVEVYHSSFSKEETDSLIQYCEENNLLMSGGTDCHGEKRADIQLGIGYGNMNIEKDILKDWIK